MRLHGSYLSAVIMAGLAMGCGGVEEPLAEEENVASAKQSLVVDCPYPAPSGAAIDFNKEMIIRSRSVVDDPCRTLWTGGAGCSTRLGKWTFGQLLADMSGSGDPTSTTSRSFVGRFMKFWLSSQMVTGDPNPVAARGNFRPNFLDPWLVASGCAAGSDPAVCMLDLKKAPFRLLAIVNRIDMAGFDYASGLSGPGELRFVFGALGTGGAMLKSVFILEYRYPSSRTAQQWAQSFHGLSAQTLLPTPPTGTGTTAFADALQNITDLVVGLNKNPGGHNGNAIGQIRTNENDFDSATGFSKKWEFRQFTLPCTSGTCDLAQVQVSQTPPTVANNTAAINNFLINNQWPLMNSTHIVPNSLLGGSSLSLPGNSAVLWEVPNPVTSPQTGVSPEQVRHHFGFATCNGCHYLETANQNQQFHIAPRLPTATSTLSGFLGFADSLASATGSTPDNIFTVADPDLNSSVVFEYNEPWRRACEIRRIIYGDTFSFSSATGHSIF